MSYIFYSHYNMDWIANTEIGLDSNNSVIKRLRCAGNLPVVDLCTKKLKPIKIIDHPNITYSLFTMDTKHKK